MIVPDKIISTNCRFAFTPIATILDTEPISKSDEKTKQIAASLFLFDRDKRNILFHILSFLDLPDLAKFSLVNKKANWIVSDPKIWRLIAAQIGCSVIERSPNPIYRQVLHFIARIQKEVSNRSYSASRIKEIDSKLKRPKIHEINQIQDWLQAYKTLNRSVGFEESGDNDGKISLPALQPPENVDHLDTIQKTIDRAEEFTNWLKEDRNAQIARIIIVTWNILANREGVEEGPNLADLDNKLAIINRSSEFDGWFTRNLDALAESLEYLDIAEMDLTLLPRQVCNLTNLTNLFLDKNHLASLPEETGKLINLKVLDLNENQFSTVPKEIFELINLEELCLCNNLLTSLPKEIGKLINLQILVLRKNQLSSVPNEIGKLINLEKLDLSINQLSTVPKEIGKLIKLLTLLLHANLFTDIPNEIWKRSVLDCPVLGNIQDPIDLRPEDTFNLSVEQEHYLNENLISFEPLQTGDEILGYPLENCPLGPGPSQTSNFLELTKLNLSENHLSYAPEEICDIPNLEMLYLRDNRLTSLPSKIGKLKKLKSIDLRNNLLSSLPLQFSRLNQLEFLDLIKNKFIEMPQQVHDLTKLSHLDLRENPISAVTMRINNLIETEFLLFQLQRPHKAHEDPRL